MTGNAPTQSSQVRGVVSALLCYGVWGLFPLFWKQLAEIDAIELIAHRHVWSLVFVLGIIAAQRGLGEVRAAFSGWKAVGFNALSAVLLTTNWLVYVWGVNTGHVVEASLGYFLVPLVNVAAGRLVLHEQLRRAQWLAILLAAIGVGILVAQVGRPPWIALALAVTWGGYSLMRKKSQQGAFTGLAVETLLMAPLALGFLIWRAKDGEGALGHVSLGQTILVLSVGVVTAVPLLLFAHAARRIRLSTLGLLQYLTPSIQFLLGVWIYREPFPKERVLCFGLIWAGLALYTMDSVWVQRRTLRAQTR